MKRIISIFLVFVICFFWFVKPIKAVSDPLSVSNNKFGIHVLEIDDLEAAAKLVNSQKGQWGYVTLVIRQNDQNLDKWQKIFDQCRKLKLIPIVRIATKPVSDYWAKPELKDIDNWVKFLDSLNWVIQNRYLVLFNEPNHKKEWGGDINPQEYVTITKAFHSALKESSKDYFILPAGFDTAAPNSSQTMTATEYWRQMHQEDNQIFTLFDGWNSHSYPNPGFSGPVSGQGFGSLRSYQAEISYLSKYNLKSNLPIFITETGWIHQQGKVLGATTNQTSALSDFFTTAFTSIWNQKNLVAITPFVLNYPQPPFSQFAWQEPNTDDFFPHYYAVKNLEKNSGQPVQIHNSQLISSNIPSQLIDSSTYRFSTTFKNTGQSIWNQDFFLKPTGDFPTNNITITKLESTKPFSDHTFTIDLTTPETPGEYQLNFQLQTNLSLFGEEFSNTIKVIPPPSLIIKAKRLFIKDRSETDYQLLIYNQDQTLVKEMAVNLKNQLSQPIKLYSVIPETIYRFVLLKPFYLPRQTISTLNSSSTQIQFKTLLPLDTNNDGQLTFKDLFIWQRFST